MGAGLCFQSYRLQECADDGRAAPSLGIKIRGTGLGTIEPIDTSRVFHVPGRKRGQGRSCPAGRGFNYMHRRKKGRTDSWGGGGGGITIFFITRPPEAEQSPETKWM